jgi:hypothetical protein
MNKSQETLLHLKTKHEGNIYPYLTVLAIYFIIFKISHLVLIFATNIQISFVQFRFRCT